jgi:hypothetical protein
MWMRGRSNLLNTIIKTNWINIVGVFIPVLVYAVILNLIDGGISRSLFQSIFAALILVCLYGMMFWIMFIVALIILDLLLVIRTQKNLKIKLGMEWLIVRCPFSYWAMEYQEWIFLVAITAFLITQFIRGKYISTATASL